MEATFLGHQGWLVAGGSASILIDPLLTDSFGHGGHVGLVHPPRTIELARIDAVVITHEHEDHFDIPSLLRIDRRTPIHLSERSSIAARTILRELGFAVELLRPLHALRIGDLEVMPLWSDPRGLSDDEWDVLPLVVRTGDDGLLSTVDVELTPPIEAAAAKLLRAPAVHVVANNHTSFAFQDGSAPREESAAITRDLLARTQRLSERGLPPGAIAITGGGFAFTGDRAWMNQHVFAADSEAIARALDAVLPVPCLAPRPGDRLVLSSGEVRVEAAPMITRGEGPSRAFHPTVRMHDAYAPASGSRTLPDLDALLADFARWLHGGPLFRALFAIPPTEAPAREHTLALVLLHGDTDAVVHAYEPIACRFVRREVEDPLATFVAGLECWASDLAALLRSELGPTAITFGRMRRWSFTHAPLAIEDALWSYAHPSRDPEGWLRRYRALAAEH